MARSLNKIMIIGNVGRVSEIRFTPTGKEVITFSVATSRHWNNAEGVKQTATDWFTVVAWGSLARVCADHLSKGKQVYVEGRVQARKWDDKDGNKHSSFEIVANEMMVLSDRKENETLNDPFTDDNFSASDEYPF